MPTSLPNASITGSPLIRFSKRILAAFAISVSGETVMISLVMISFDLSMATFHLFQRFSEAKQIYLPLADLTGEPCAWLKRL
jgi:hypothetical protein